MATKTYELPLTVTLGNKGTKTVAFQPYRENFNVEIKAGDSIVIPVRKSSEAIYYEYQASGDLIVGQSDASVSQSAGTYDAATGTFTTDATYSIIADGDASTVIGVIPFYESAPLGLGNNVNVFTVKIAKAGITSRDDLPSGDICKVTNTEVEGKFNVYKKNAFEDDGSLISLVKVKKGSKIEIMVKWTDDGDFETYTFNIDAEMQTV